MGFPGAHGIIFPVVILRAAVMVLLIKETALSVMNLLLGRGWENPSTRVLAITSPTYYWNSEDEGFSGMGIGFEPVDAQARVEQIKKSLPVVRFRDISHEVTDEEDEEECSVCLCVFNRGDNVRQIPYCSHVFHKDCLDKWLGHCQSTCPLCRASLGAVDEQKSGVLAELANQPSYQMSADRTGHMWFTYLDVFPEFVSGSH